MVLQKITSTLILLTIFFVSILGVFTLQLPAASASLISPGVTEANSIETITCPIEGTIWASFSDAGEKLYVEDVFYSKILLSNNSAYTFGGVRLAVAVYKSPSDTVPAYWTVLPDEQLLLSNLSLSVVAELDLSILSAGEYTVKVFVMQGDETALLGAALRDVEHTEGITIVKSTPKKSDVSVSVTVNNQSYDGRPLLLEDREPLVVEIKTKNGNSLPLIGSSMLGVITQGEVPLGTAVRSDKLDLVKLIPGGTRVTDLTDNFVEGGKYTVYAGLINPNILSPLVKVPVMFSDSKYESSWSYISKIGLSSYPLQSDSELVACVDNIGANNDQELFSEPLGIKLSLSAKTGEVFTELLNSLEVDTGNYFVFRPRMQIADFTLSLDLLQQRFSAELVAGDDYVGKQLVTDEMSVVDTITQLFVCVEGDLCGQTVAASTSGNNSVLPQRPFWFYAAIVISAALLLFIMLRRLPPEKVVTAKNLSSNELQ